MNIVALLLILFFDSASIDGIIIGVLAIVGEWAMLRKVGIPGWHAFIPFLSQYEIGRSTGRPDEGNILAVVKILSMVCSIVITFLPNESDFLVLFAGIALALLLVNAAYRIRIYLSICDQYERSRKWTFLWVISSGMWALVWGFLPKYQPKWKPSDVENKVSQYFSNANAEVLDNGLTVNIQERVASEMFKKKYLLRDIHMNIQPGHMVLLLGGSGAGKTTLLNAINGYEKAKAEIVLNGQNVYKDYKHMQYQIGFVPQQELMRGSDTVLNTLKDAATLRLPAEFTAEQREQRVQAVMDIFGLTPVKSNLVDKLSGGQKKRLSIAMEFISNPSLFILDEPDSSLDGVMARALMQQLRDIANQGKIVIVITHTPDRVIDLFDDVIVLAKDSGRTGRLAYFGSVKDSYSFFERESMEKIVLSINRKEEGGDGLADEFVKKYAEVQHG